MIDIEVRPEIVSMTNVDEKELIKTLCENMLIEDILLTINENITDTEYLDMINWFDENHDLGCMIDQLDNQRIDEIVEYLNTRRK